MCIFFHIFQVLHVLHVLVCFFRVYFFALYLHISHYFSAHFGIFLPAFCKFLHIEHIFCIFLHIVHISVLHSVSQKCKFSAKNCMNCLNLDENCTNWHKICFILLDQPLGPVTRDPAQGPRGTRRPDPGPGTQAPPCPGHGRELIGPLPFTAAAGGHSLQCISLLCSMQLPIMMRVPIGLAILDTQPCISASGTSYQ